MQFKASGEHQPKGLRIDRFNFRANLFSMTFKHVKSAQQFVDLWSYQIKPFLTKVAGVYKPIVQSTVCTESTVRTAESNSPEDSELLNSSACPSSSVMSSTSTSYEPPAKRKKVDQDVQDSSMTLDANVAEKYIGKLTAESCISNGPQKRMSYHTSKRGRVSCSIEHCLESTCAKNDTCKKWRTSC